MNRFTAFFDANIFYSAALSDLMMRIIAQNVFRAKWSNQVHEEWMTALLRNRPDLTREKLERRRDLMNQHAGDCLTNGYEALIEGLSLPDPNDRHVLAAAIRAGAGVIVTRNLKDFPSDKLLVYGIEAQHPDEFLMHLFDLNLSSVLAAVREHRESLKNPSKSVSEYLDSLERQELTQTAAALREYFSLI